MTAKDATEPPSSSVESFPLTQEFDAEKIRSLLCCALEGGSNYWYVIVGYQYPKGRAPSDYGEGGAAQDGKDYWPRCQLLPTHEGGAVVIRTDRNDQIGDKKRWKLDREAIQCGLGVMAEEYPQHFADFVAGNEDADTGDVFLQCCLFGEVVFG